MMLKRNKLILCAMVIAIIFAFAAPPNGNAAPPSSTKDNECMVKWGNKWFTIGLSYDTDGYWPQKTTCPDGSGGTFEAARFMYEVTGGKWSAAEWYQTVPGQRPGTDQYVVYPKGASADECSFSSIEYIGPGEGADPSKFGCFSPHLGGEALVNYQSTPTGSPIKFGHAANQWGANGWTSLVFKIGNEVLYCQQYKDDVAVGYGLPGPAMGDKSRIVRNVTKTISIDRGDLPPIDVRLEINETECTFRAFDPITDEEYTQFAITKMEVSDPHSDPAQVSEGWGSGKCDEIAFAGKINPVCADYCLGGWCINIPDCRPCNPNAERFCPGATPP